ncbi:MAG TPA: DUF2169 domain-containing protein [Planctomycetota bacterium]|nr:DUF2169 domain-containing protein [Planctomycetota bacterium]
MIHKNLTPFFWGPRVTSRKPPQPEMAICVRAVFRLVPGQPLEVIADPMQQGFMSGDLFLPDDIDQKGALLYSGDFAEWKLHADLLLRGTCHPPGGSATTCDVRFGVGTWSKSLRVVGPRAYKPGLLIGGTMSDPQPFERMPLSWENAYGGEGFGTNPVGRGYAGEDMPTVEAPGSPVTKKGKGGITPGTFLPISPNWPQRAGKRGKKYDATWKKTRAPFYAEDFDWTYFQGAASDQWLDGYLHGDEDVVFENLHPSAPKWQTKLPGLRVRAFVKTLDGAVREPDMHLDTLLADTDDGKLYLTWRGHAPIQEIDMTDVGVVLIASEPLAEQPKSFEHYAALLAEFEEDPVGLEGAFPPGFMEVANAVEAAELAERNGEPMPDLAKLAASLPAGCPFPPWFLAAVAGDEDPLGVKAKFPPGMLDGNDPLGLKAKVGDLGDQKKLEKALAGVPKPEADPAAPALMLQAIAGLMPPDKQPALLGTVDALKKALAQDQVAKALAATAGAAATAPVPAASGYTQALAQSKAAMAGSAGEAGTAQLALLPGSLDEPVAQALAPLDSMELPEVPPIPDVEADLAAKTAELDEQEAKLRGKYGDHPILGMFAMGHRLIANAPRPADIAPDLSPLVAGLGKAHAGLMAQGISAAALAPLTRLIGKVDALVAKIPKRPPPPDGEFAQKDLDGRDFSRRDLRGAVFARSKLARATFVGADLTGADFGGADLTGADFTDAILTDANLSRCTMTKAVLVNAKSQRAMFVDAELGSADGSGGDFEGARFDQARLVKARLPKARLVDADLQFADLSKADLQGADLTGAKLSLATLNLVKGDGAILAKVVFDMGKITKCRLRGASFVGARSSMGSLGGSDLTGADLRGVQFDKVDFMKTVLDGADCRGASLQKAIFRDVQAIGTNFDDADLAAASATGAATFAKASFRNATGKRCVWMDADLTGADLSRSRFEHAYFQGILGEDVDFSAAVLKGACFRKARLVRPRFAGADLAGADFNCAQLDDANFREANCYDAKFLGARAVRSDFEGAFVVALQLDDPGARR